MSYAYREGKIYFHAARTGHKIDAIARCSKASFCVVDQDKIVPEKFTTHYRSAIAFGRIRVAEDPEEILTGLQGTGGEVQPRSGYRAGGGDPEGTGSGGGTGAHRGAPHRQAGH